MKRRAGWMILGCAVLAGACSEDPIYVDPQLSFEFDPASADPLAAPGSAAFDLPVRLERPEEAEVRAALAAELGVDVPWVPRDGLDLSLEWTLTNLDPDAEMRAEVFLNGANEYFRYVPFAFVVDPEEDQAPPNLVDSVPLIVPAGGVLSGVFREDQLREAAIDLDMITRGVGGNPFAALLASHEDLTSFPSAAGPEIPLEAIPSLVRFEVGVTANRPARVEFALRVREDKDYLHEELLHAPAGELTVFAPVDFAPVLP